MVAKSSYGTIRQLLGEFLRYDEQRVRPNPSRTEWKTKELCLENPRKFEFRAVEKDIEAESCAVKPLGENLPRDWLLIPERFQSLQLEGALYGIFRP